MTQNTESASRRLFKRWIHEGGVTTPFIVYWPERIKKPEIKHAPMQIIDISATLYELAGAAYPAEFTDQPIIQ